jgi:hypothetical protein
MKPLGLCCLVVTVLAATVPSFAQQVISAKSGLLNYSEGDVTIDAAPVDLSGVHFSEVKENSVVKTTDGRAEMLLTPGVVLRLGENSSLRMVRNRLIDTRLELLTGSAVVEADQIAKDTSVTIVCKDATVTLPKAGLYRFDTEPAQMKVYKGDADVEMAGNTTSVSSGHLTSLTGDKTLVAKFDADNTDPLDRWSHRRGSYLAMANTSAANGLMVGSGYGAGYPGWGMNGCSSAWAWNTYYSMMTYMPCSGSFYSPYGYRFWSPWAIYGYNGYAPGIWGGGASRTGVSGSGSASLARPAATASNRANSPAAQVGSSRATFGNNGNMGRVGAVAPAMASSNGGFAGGSGASSGGGGGGFAGGSRGVSAGAGGGGGGAARAGGGGGGSRGK